MEFQQEIIAVRTTKRVAFLPVMVGVGSGLAYARVHHQSYDLIHVASGWFLCRGPSTQKAAQEWIARLSTLTDWAQNEQVIARLPQELIRRVPELRDEVIASIEELS
ncbi:MAG TPA: hypothetical protein VNG51_16640 [Ktedonobacteraceae bacterium]|nr:hypothetical protein [Ktedonobacteraceae bacterium]